MSEGGVLSPSPAPALLGRSLPPRDGRADAPPRAPGPSSRSAAVRASCGVRKSKNAPFERSAPCSEQPRPLPPVACGESLACILRDERPSAHPDRRSRERERRRSRRTRPCSRGGGPAAAALVDQDVALGGGHRAAAASHPPDVRAGERRTFVVCAPAPPPPPPRLLPARR